jgi:DUF4097 and DUF4098 domain-containing protein YvlB
MYQGDLTSTAVHVIRTDGGDVRLVYNNNSRPRLKLECVLEGGVLDVRQKPRLLAMMYPTTLDIYLPAGYDKDLFVNVNSGDVSMDKFNFRKLTLSFFSGNIATESLKASDLTINVSSGNVAVGSVEAGSFTVGGSSMKLLVSNCVVNNANIAGASGSVEILNCVGNYDLRFTSANVRLAFKKFDGCNAGVTTTSGNVLLELPATAQFSFESHTTSGRFDTDFSIVPPFAPGQGDLQGFVGTKDNKIFLKATSGNMRIARIR